METRQQHLPVSATVAARLLAVFGVIFPTQVCSQTVRGQVLDANLEAAIPAAEVVVSGSEGYRIQLLTDSLGSFTVRLPAAGSYWLRASALGYAMSDSAAVTLEHNRELVEVQLRLSVEPLTVEGFTVVSRGLELRHQATFEGFIERHESAPSVGPARVVSIEDPIMAASAHVGEVLQWFPVERRGCTVVFVDGRVRTGWGDVDMENVKGLAGIEFYVDYRDAPLEFRGGGPPCLNNPQFSVLVLWRERLPGGGG